jgi:hypothetical protein
MKDINNGKYQLLGSKSQLVDKEEILDYLELGWQQLLAIDELCFAQLRCEVIFCFATLRINNFLRISL